MSSHIKTLLTPILQSKKLAWKIALLEQWPEIMGNLAGHVSIEKMHDDAIVLAVQDSSWLQELYLMGATILDTINKSLDQPRFKSIRFKQKGQSLYKKEKIKSISAPKIQCISFSKQEQNALSHISNSQLRDALRSFLIRCHQERNR